MSADPPIASKTFSSHVTWPLWAKVYAVVVGAPMVSVALGLALWLTLTRFDGALIDRPVVASWILIVTVFLNFLTAAWLFYVAIRRTVAGQPEALILAAAGHVLVTIPPLVTLMVGFVLDAEQLLHALSSAVTDRTFVLELKLIVWVLLHTYLALFLSLADNTSRVLDALAWHARSDGKSVVP